MAGFTEQGEIFLDAGDMGGDVQATDAASRRFVKPLDDGTFAVVEVNAYGISEDRNDEVQLDVQEQIFWTHCHDAEDPGGTEITSEVTYDYPFSIGPASLAVARDWAEHYVRGFDPEHIDWDGRSTIQH